MKICQPRGKIIDRRYRVFTYQSVDRVPDIEFGYWPQTIRRWLGEGMKIELTENEKNSMFLAKLDAFFGFDQDPTMHFIPLRMQMNPAYEHRVVETKADGSVIQIDSNGVTAHVYPSSVDSSSIPHYLRFPIETPEDWQQMKSRFRLDDPIRSRPSTEIDEIRQAVLANKGVGFFATGFYGQLRNWMGMENLSTAFYDYPDMIRDMVDTWAELIVSQIESLPADIPIDVAQWWEDMACKNGPLCGPKLFREFLQPGYARVMNEARRRGCVIGMVDCDGDPHDIVLNWMEEGVNIMFPLEVAAGVDPYAWRREFGLQLRLQGGVGKTPLVEGGAAIDRELERLRPLFEQGGFIPHLDHLAPPDIPYKNYCEYLEKKRKFIGK